MKKIICIAMIVCLALNCGIVTAFASNNERDIQQEIAYTVNGDEDKKIDITQLPDKTIESNGLVIERKYVRISTEISSARLELNNLSYNFLLDDVNQYDYVVVSFVSTENVMLNDYHTLSYDYPTITKMVEISFNVNSNNIISLDSVPVYSEAKFEKIYVVIDAYIEQSVVESSMLKLSVLSTEQGVFVSEHGDIYAYDNYISYLYSNSLISDQQYNLIQKRVTELSEIAADNGKASETIPVKEVVRYYDMATDEVAIKSIDNFSELQRYVPQIETASISLMSTTTNGTIVAPSLTVSRTITSIDSGKQLRVYGYVTWTDIEGNSHPARNIEVQIMDKDITFDDTLATVYTSNYGYYTATVTNQTGINENGCDIYIRVNTKNSKFKIGTNIASSMFSDGYYFTTGVTDNVKESKDIVTYSGSNSDAFRAVSVQQALVVGYYYYETMNNDSVNSISVVYPGGTNGSWSNSFWDLVNIEYNDYCDWDVILHELGHQVASKIGVSASFTDSHIDSENLSERYGKSKGIKGGWSEGWASYFSMAAQLYYNRYVATISNITNVADNTYSDLSFTNSDTTFSGWSRDYTTYSGYTDGNEAAVTCVLLHLIIDNDIALSHQEVWNIAKASKCDSLSGFMKTLYSSVDKSLYSAIGTQLERQNIADAPNVKTSIFSRENPGTFYWTPAATRDNISDNNNYVYYNRATITFFDKNYNIVLQSPYISSALGTYGTPINDIQWKALNLSINNGDPFYWCISTSQNDNPGTGPYYSSLHKAYFSEDITTIANTNIQYSGYLNAYNDVVYKFVAPESGYYTFNSTGDTDVNVTLYTNTLLEGNSISNDDGGEGLNFLYDKYLLSGTTVYLKVGGYRSASGPFNIIAIRYTSTTVNTSKSMAINGTNGVWFRFVAPSNGSYTFYTTGDIDVYGELFSYPASNGSTNGRLTYNDDSGSGRNCLFTYDLSKNTVVYVRIRGYSSSITGNCCLCIAATPIVENLDTSYSGTLVANGYTIYKFTAPSTGEYTFFTTGNTDTFMDIFSEPVLDRTTTTNRLAYNDDGGVSRNSSITYSLYHGQSVFVRIRGYSTTTTGAYCLAIVKSTTIATLNTGYSGTLDNGSILWYTFTAPQSGEYTFYTTGDTDTYGDALNFFVPDGSLDNLICSNDDDEDVDLTTLNFRLVLSLSAGQTVYIRVRGYSTSTSGSFAIYADKWEE